MTERAQGGGQPRVSSTRVVYLPVGGPDMAPNPPLVAAGEAGPRLDDC